jgi:intein/homing endonuclease
MLGYNETTGEVGEYRVSDVIAHTDTFIVHMTIDDERIETTAEHPFFTEERGWVSAGELQIGEHVLAGDPERQALEVARLCIARAPHLAA